MHTNGKTHDQIIEQFNVLGWNISNWSDALVAQSEIIETAARNKALRQSEMVVSDGATVCVPSLPSYEVTCSPRVTKLFYSLEAAILFGDAHGTFDVWVNGHLFLSCMKNCFTEQFESEVFNEA